DGLEGTRTTTSELKMALHGLRDIKGCRVLISASEQYFEHLLNDEILDDEGHTAIKLNYEVIAPVVEKTVGPELNRLNITRKDESLQWKVIRTISDMVKRYFNLIS